MSEKPTTSADTEDEEVCGESFDHDLDWSSDEPPRSGVCRRCGAELWEDEDA